MTLDETDQQERLAVEAARVRQSGNLGRSETLIRLFDFLLAQSLAGRAPKEIEVAQEVFDKSTNFDTMLDASVRVYIHRLRRKLSEHYSDAASNPDRISIPLGEYRMVLASTQAAEEAQEQPTVNHAGAMLRMGRLWLYAVALALINAVGWIYYAGRPSVDARPVTSNFWKPIAESKQPTLVVLGDYYIFGEATDSINISRLIRDFSINSREELDAYLMLNPDKIGRYADLNLHYLPVSSGRALRSLLPVVNAASELSGIRPQVENMSDLKPEILKNLNIVYIGFLSGLGPLQAPVFKASGFEIGNSFDELVDKGNGRRFQSDSGGEPGSKTPQRNYGYLASLPGPAGNRILIIAGTRDPAVAQMAEVAANQKQLDLIDAKSDGGAFEALFEVRTLSNLNMGSSLLLVRPIRADSIWQPDQPGLSSGN
jgi:hypothetical protein